MKIVSVNAAKTKSFGDVTFNVDQLASPAVLSKLSIGSLVATVDDGCLRLRMSGNFEGMAITHTEVAEMNKHIASLEDYEQKEIALKISQHKSLISLVAQNTRLLAE